jgi:hypothetical protein
VKLRVTQTPTNRHTDKVNVSELWSPREAGRDRSGGAHDATQRPYERRNRRRAAPGGKAGKRSPRSVAASGSASRRSTAGKNSSPACSVRKTSELFSDNLLQEVAIQRQVADQLLQLAVFVAQRPQLADLLDAKRSSSTRSARLLRRYRPSFSELCRNAKSAGWVLSAASSKRSGRGRDEP